MSISNSFSLSFPSFGLGESNGKAVVGKVSSVEVVPVSMDLENEAKDPDTGKTINPWGFWAWFWTIACIILVGIFLLGGWGGGWNSDTVLGGVIVCIVPAVIILVVYFGFVFGSGI